MGYAMAKVVALLCMSLLVMHVDSARMLKEADTSEIMTAQTSRSEEAPPVEEASQFETIPAPDSPADYDYNNKAAITDDSSESAPEGFLVPPPPTDTNDKDFASESFFVQDEGTDRAMFADEGPVQEGNRWDPDGSDATTESSGDQSDGFLVDTQGTDESKSYVFDAKSQDADDVYPHQGESDSLADMSSFDFPGEGTQETTEQEPDFVFDENKDELGN